MHEAAALTSTVPGTARGCDSFSSSTVPGIASCFGSTGVRTSATRVAGSAASRSSFDWSGVVQSSRRTPPVPRPSGLSA